MALKISKTKKSPPDFMSGGDVAQRSFGVDFCFETFREERGFCFEVRRFVFSGWWDRRCTGEDLFIEPTNIVSNNYTI